MVTIVVPAESCRVPVEPGESSQSGSRSGAEGLGLSYVPVRTYFWPARPASNSARTAELRFA